MCKTLKFEVRGLDCCRIDYTYTLQEHMCGNALMASGIHQVPENSPQLPTIATRSGTGPFNHQYVFKGPKLIGIEKGAPGLLIVSGNRGRAPPWLLH